MSNDWIDAEGYRANVGIILMNSDKRLMLGRRIDSKGWQFPQGGMMQGEEPVEAMFRELFEEIGLVETDVEVLGVTGDWLRYELPDKFIRRNSKPLCIGQKQHWFLLRLLSGNSAIRFDQCDEPEFDRVRWVDFWCPVNEIVYFKRRVYARALYELGHSVHPEGLPERPRSWPKSWISAFDKDIFELEDKS
ncbi:MAG: RNA pyrophosphohydrolase [Woeseiaceae bacterium]|nr:RNA pyrophosphohydrolase [Woeseiaceae bacterium]